MKIAVYLAAAAVLVFWNVSVVAAEPAKQCRATSAPGEADLSSPKAVLAGVHAAMTAGDADLAGSYWEPTWQAYMKRSAACMMKTARLTEKVLAAARAKWTAQDADKLGKTAMFGLKLAQQTWAEPVLKDGQIDWSKVKIEQEQDTANVTIDGKPGAKLIKLDGKWYLPGPSGVAAHDVELSLKKQEAQTSVLTRIYEAIAAGISDGAITPANVHEKFKEFASAGAPAPAASVATGAASSQPSTAPVKVDLTSPESVIDTLRAAAADRDRSALAKCVMPDKRRDFARVMALDLRLETMQAPVIAAIREKFPEDMAKYVLSGNLFHKVMPDTLAPVARLAHIAAADKVEMRPDGTKDEMHVHIGHYFFELDLKRIDGKWYACPALPADLDKEIKLAEQDFEMFEGFYKDVEKGVKDGSLTPRTWSAGTLRLLAKHFEQGQ